jgi:hypothetical protein
MSEDVMGEFFIGCNYKPLGDIRPLLPQLLEKEEWLGRRAINNNPIIDRIYCTVDGIRVCLHMMYPCATYETMWHSHGWPSHIELVSGKQQVGFALDDKEYHKKGITIVPTPTAGINCPDIDEVMILSRRQGYSMPVNKAWHYVRPLEGPSFSIMVNGPLVDTNRTAGGNRNCMSKEEVDTYKFIWKSLLREPS